MEPPPAKVEDLKSRANALAAKGDVAAALAVCEEAIALAPQDATLYANRSALNLKLGKAEPALADAEKVLTLRPEWARGYQRKGLVLLHLQQVAEAVLWLERGAALDPEDAALQRAVVAARARRDGLKVSFTLMCGHGKYGQLGEESMIDVKMGGQSVLARFKAFEGKGVTAMCGAKFYYLCLLANGEVYEWGRVPSVDANADPIVTEPRLVPGLKGKRIVQIAAGVSHALFLSAGGVVYARGRVSTGAVGVLSLAHVAEPEAVTALSAVGKIARIAAGYYHSLALTEGGELYAWGDCKGLPATRLPTRVEQVPGLITYIAAGAFASAAVTEDGRLWTWGDNNRHALGHAGEAQSVIPSPVASLAGLPVWRVALGRHVGAAVTAAGQVFVWGSNRAYPKPHSHGEGLKIAAAAQFPALPQLVPSDVVKGDIDHIVAGKAFVAVLTVSGKLFTYGHNGFGQLGAGRPSLRKYNCAFEAWTEVLTPFRIASVAASHYNLFASVVNSPDAGKASLLRILETEQHTDITFVVGGRPIPAHRAMLWARCPLLYEKHAATAAPGAVVTLEGETDGVAFQEMLRYVYADRTDIASELAPRVLHFAKAWALPRLAAACLHAKDKKMPVAESTMGADLGRLLASAHLADVALHCADGAEPVRAHKFMLAARCEYFRAMFAGTMKERTAERVELPQVSADVLKNVLTYLYTERTVLDAATSVDQLVVANLYCLEELKLACAMEIGQHIDTDNVFLLWQLSQTHECPQLGRRCMRFLEVHAADPALQNHKDWNDMPPESRGVLAPILQRGRKGRNVKP